MSLFDAQMCLFLPHWEVWAYELTGKIKPAKQETLTTVYWRLLKKLGKQILIHQLGSRLIFRREGKWPFDEIPLGFLFRLRWLLAKTFFPLLKNAGKQLCCSPNFWWAAAKRSLRTTGPSSYAKPMRRLGVRKRDTGTLCVDLSSTSFWACLVDVVSRTWSSGS